MEVHSKIYMKLKYQAYFKFAMEKEFSAPEKMMINGPAQALPPSAAMTNTKYLA